jgi:hypothetical protein
VAVTQPAQNKTPEKQRKGKIVSRQTVFIFKTLPNAHSVYFPTALNWEKNFAAFIDRL